MIKKIGFCGLGVVGGALKQWIQEKTEHEIKIYDPGCNYFDDFNDCDAVFIAVPVAIKEFKEDLSIIDESIRRCPQGAKIFIRSTVTPGTCDMLSKKHDKIISAMPEFLTERRAFDDMCKNDIIVGFPEDCPESYDIYKTALDIFDDKKQIHYVKNKEAEMTKFTHNCAGAVKVTYWNIINSLCENEKIDFNKVRNLSLLTGYINKEHTNVPGPDSKKGYGGKCFRPNIKAMMGYTKNHASIAFFKDVFCLNQLFRGGDIE